MLFLTGGRTICIAYFAVIQLILWHFTISLSQFFMNEIYVKISINKMNKCLDAKQYSLLLPCYEILAPVFWQHKHCLFLTLTLCQREAARAFENDHE